MTLFSRKSVCLIAAVTACGLAPGVRAESTETANPEYVSWAKCKPGATAKIAGKSEAMGQKTSQTITTKLLELTPEKAVVETKMSIQVMGQSMDQPAQKRDVPAEIKMPKAGTNDAVAQEKLKDYVKANSKEPKKGEETVTVAGKSLACKTSEVTNSSNGMNVVAKTWHSDEVPGGLVKMESKTTGSMTSTTTMELVEFTTGE